MPRSPSDVRGLLLYRIARIATLSDRSGQLNLSRRFGLNLGDWRVLSVIRALAPVTLTDLVGELHLDKGQLSRSISNLVGRSLVRQTASRQNRRRTLLELTAEGHRLHDRILPFVIGRNATMMRDLNARERKELLRLLDKVMEAVTRSYRELLEPQALDAASGSGASMK